MNMIAHLCFIFSVLVTSFAFANSANAATNLLTNASFEMPDASAGDVGPTFPCGGSEGTFGAWNYFNCNFVTSNTFMPGGSFVNPTAHSGDQVLKQFGVDAGAFQDAVSNPGDSIVASVYAMNWNGDNFNNIFLLQIFALDSSGNNISGGFTPLAQVAAGSNEIGGIFDYVLFGTDGGNQYDWTLMEVSAVAPAGTASTRIQLIHILESSTPNSGAIFLDDASLTVMPATVHIQVDIKPDSDINSVNTDSNGVITVAVLTSEDFDALQVDPDTARFGPAEAAKAHSQAHVEDVDYDGDMDLVFHFRTQETGMQCGDTEATLTGETWDGIPVSGTDSVDTVSCE